jgi:hypothetical protein
MLYPTELRAQRTAVKSFTRQSGTACLPDDNLAYGQPSTSIGIPGLFVGLGDVAVLGVTFHEHPAARQHLSGPISPNGTQDRAILQEDRG